MSKPLFPRWRKAHIERLTIAHAALVSACNLLSRSSWPGQPGVRANIDCADEVISELFNFVEQHIEGKLAPRAEAAPVDGQLEGVTQPGEIQNPDPNLPGEEH